MRTRGSATRISSSMTVSTSNGAHGHARHLVETMGLERTTPLTCQAGSEAEATLARTVKCCSGAMSGDVDDRSRPTILHRDRHDVGTHRCAVTYAPLVPTDSAAPVEAEQRP